MTAAEMMAKAERQPIVKVWRPGADGGTIFRWGMGTEVKCLLADYVAGHQAQLPAVRCIYKDGREQLYILAPGDMVDFDPLPTPRKTP